MSSSKNNKSKLEEKSIKLQDASQKSSGKSAGKSAKTSGSKSMKVKGEEKSSNSKSNKKSAKFAISKSGNANPSTSKKSCVISKAGTENSKTSSVSKSLSSSKPSSGVSAKKDSKFLGNVKLIQTKSDSSTTSESGKISSRSVSGSSNTSRDVKFKPMKRDSKLYRCVESYQEKEHKFDFNAFIGEPITIGHSKDQSQPTSSSNELENVISLPILKETPSFFNMLTNSSLAVDKEESSTGGPQPVLSTIRGNPAADMPETTMTDAPTRNYVLSAVSLVEGHCGSAPTPAKPQALSTKRQLINVRYLLDGTVQPVGLLLGSIHCYLNCLYEPTHVFVRTALVTPEGAAKTTSRPENDVALDICQVSETDSSKVGRVYQIENKPNLITVTPSAEGRVFFYDQTGRGIEVCSGSQLKLDADRITLWIGHVGLAKSTTQTPSPTCPLEVTKVERPQKTKSVSEKSEKANKTNDETKRHNILVNSGTATLLLWRTGPSSQFSKDMNTDRSACQIDVMLVLEDLRQCGGISIDELLLWDERMEQAKKQADRVDVAQTKKSDCLAEGIFPALAFASAQVSDFAMEYLIFGSSRLTAGLITVGVLTGTVAGFLHSPPVTLKDIPGDCLHLHLALTDIHNRSLAKVRKKVFHLPDGQRLRVSVGSNAVVNVCGDQGGGWIVAPGSVLTLSCARLLQLYRCAKSASGAPVKLDTATQVVALKEKEARRLVINTGEATFLITDNAKTVAFYIH